MKKVLTVLLCALMLFQLLFAVGCSSQKEAGTATKTDTVTKTDTATDAGTAADTLCDSMTLAQKVAQMIMPSMRTWEGEDNGVTVLGDYPALAEAHEAGAKFILLSGNLPVDAARFQEADAIVCAYQSSGVGVDPTERTKGSENVGAFNANIPAAVSAIFGASDMTGKLPIDIPVLTKSADGMWGYGDEILYRRGCSAAG